MSQNTDDERIAGYRPLIPPAILMEELPVSEKASNTISKARTDIEKIIRGQDDRLLVVAGPCSIHDTKAALEYADLLGEYRVRFKNELHLIMRVYFEKPRTTIGWKGLINDPNLDSTFDINKGLKKARKLLLDLAGKDIPAGTEFLDVITPQHIADLISWGAIGARTTESQLHRELSSGSSMPIGFKNGTEGSIQIAVDAIGAARHPHHFLSVTKQGLAAIVSTKGNSACHLILRGSNAATNHDRKSISEAIQKLRTAGLHEKIMVDCSHGNSRKDHSRQPDVADDLCDQVSTGSTAIFGVMLESHLKEGKQKHEDGKELVYGQSITDSCMSWAATESVLSRLAKAVQKRRMKKG